MGRLFLLLMFACQEKTPERDVILIGGVGPLTGAHARYGASISNGINLAIRDANARGGVRGKKVVLRFYDDQARPEEAANAVTRLIAQDGVKVIIGLNASTNAMAGAPKAQAAKVPMITPSATHPKVTGWASCRLAPEDCEPWRSTEVPKVGYLSRFARSKSPSTARRKFRSAELPSRSTRAERSGAIRRPRLDERGSENDPRKWVGISAEVI